MENKKTKTKKNYYQINQNNFKKDCESIIEIFLKMKTIRKKK